MNIAARKVLVVDDDRDLLRLIAIRIEAAGHTVAQAESAEQALSSIALDRPDLVITDLRMAGMDGLALFDAIHVRAPTLPVVILTAHGTIPEAVAATRRGVFGFLTKPFEPAILLDTIAEALKLSASPDRAAEDWRAEILTRSPAMDSLLEQAKRVAVSDASVFIQGASGTGKELLARAIHRASPRANAAFVAVNCSAIPEGLLESELFGHRRGAFTGAVQDRQGLFLAADGGTLFLDEIGDMPVALQVKLLRAIEERVVRPVGASRSVEIDVRIISATHRLMEERIASGAFREDLYYRLNVVRLSTPTLAERREDIPLLATHFLGRLAKRYGRGALVFSRDAVDALVAGQWTGNVRQLRNIVEQAVALAATPVIPESLVRQALESGPDRLLPLDQERRAFERDYLVKILKITSGNVTRAARLAGRNRTEFYRLLDRHALEPGRFKSMALPA